MVKIELTSKHLLQMIKSHHYLRIIIIRTRMKFEIKINGSTKGESRTIQIEGIEIDESKPVGALWNTLAAPDGFMHIVVIKNYRKL